LIREEEEGGEEEGDDVESEIAVENRR
jgi:hypothetical protein